MGEKYDIYKEREAILTINRILNDGGTCELFLVKDGLLVREVRKKLKYATVKRGQDKDKNQSE